MENEKFEKSKKAKIWGHILYGLLAIVFCGILCLQSFVFSSQKTNQTQTSEFQNEEVLENE